MIKGTMISTLNGDIPVQDLRVGDTVTTPDGIANVSNIRIKESNVTVTVVFHRHYEAGNFKLTGDWEELVFTLPEHDRKMDNLHRIHKIDIKTDIKKVDKEYNRRIPTYLLSLDGGDYYFANGVKVRAEHGIQ